MPTPRGKSSDGGTGRLISCLCPPTAADYSSLLTLMGMGVVKNSGQGQLYMLRGTDCTEEAGHLISKLSQLQIKLEGDLYEAHGAGI